MKNLLLLCVLFSCVQSIAPKSAADINVSEIYDACEVVDVYIIVIDEMTELYDIHFPKNTTDHLPADVIDKFKILDDKLSEIVSKIRNERWIEEGDIELCTNFKELEQKIENFKSPFL